MKIVVFGGTGNVGSQVVAEAVRRGHEVTVVTRRAGTVPVGADARQGDAADAELATRLAGDADVVVSALGPSREPGGDPNAFVGVIDSLAAAVGTTRLIVVGGASSLLDENGVRLLDRPDFPPVYRAEALPSVEVLANLRASRPDLDWTYLSPAPEIGAGERTGHYTSADDTPAGSFISFADYAIALVDEIETPAHRCARFTVASR